MWDVFVTIFFVFLIFQIALTRFGLRGGVSSGIDEEMWSIIFF
jgi:hypothetical protein